MSFSSLSLTLHSTIQLIGLAGRGRAFPFTHFSTLGSSYLSRANAFIDLTTSPIRIRIWIKGSISHFYNNASLSPSSSDPPRQPQSFLYSTTSYKHKVIKPLSHTHYIYHSSTFIDNLHSDRTSIHTQHKLTLRRAIITSPLHNFGCLNKMSSYRPLMAHPPNK